MVKVIARIKYESEEPGGTPSRDYILTKEFEFPRFSEVEGTSILLKNDARKYLYTERVIYDPSEDEYQITFHSHEGVERYYHGDSEEIMEEVVARYKKFGWRVKLVNDGKQ